MKICRVLIILQNYQDVSSIHYAKQKVPSIQYFLYPSELVTCIYNDIYLTNFLLGTQKCRRTLVVEHQGGGHDAKLKGWSGVCTYTHS